MQLFPSNFTLLSRRNTLLVSCGSLFRHKCTDTSELEFSQPGPLVFQRAALIVLRSSFCSGQTAAAECRHIRINGRLIKPVVPTVCALIYLQVPGRRGRTRHEKQSSSSFSSGKSEGSFKEEWLF